MITIEPIQVHLPATQVKICGFSCGEYPVMDNSLIFNVGYYDSENNLLQTAQVSLAQSEYNNWAAGEEGEEYILNLCLQKLNITIA